ncbi:hypothetical protein DIE22_09900 [Burkholderia sp. Bp9142]|nr:hypothetical protein DIE22_09900 [Burkholderia sp. Bp9142]
MTIINIQFSDSIESEIVAYFMSPQDPAAYANLGSIDIDDQRMGIVLRKSWRLGTGAARAGWMMRQH